MIDPNPLAHAYAWFECHTGETLKCSPAYYNAFSGWMSDITELAILFSLVHVLRHTNCHKKGCLRFGKPVDGTPFRACHHHHPAHEGDKRNVSLDTIHTAFRQHKEITP